MDVLDDLALGDIVKERLAQLDTAEEVSIDALADENDRVQ
jgi:hypothetical protein